MVGRLYNVGTGSVVPNSQRLLSQVIAGVGAGPGAIGGNVTTPISERITVPGPTVIRLEVQRTNASGASSTADVWNDGNGRTSFRYYPIF